MRPLLRALPVLVLALAALESVLVRTELHYRPLEPALFLQAALLWTALGFLALLPAWLTLRLFGSRARRAPQQDAAPRGPWPPALLLGWMALPVVLHHVLDRHTAGGGDVRGVFTLRAGLELVGALVAGVALLLVLARTLRRLPGLVTGALVALASVGAGLFLPLRAAPPAASAAPGATAAADRPNLLLMVWDTCRSDRLEPYGFERPTSPYLEKLAAESIVFEDSISSAVFTFSSHLSMLTGVYPSTHGARMLRMRYDPARATTVAALLREAGYRTGGFVGTDVLAGRTGIRYGFERYEDQVDPPVCDTLAWKMIHDLQTIAAGRFPALRNNGMPHWFQHFQRPAEEVLAHALEWIREDDPRPWFCFVNLYDVHWPYLPEDASRRELVGPYSGELDGYLFRSDRWRPGRPITEDDKRHVRELYEAEIHELDRTVAAFLEALELDRGGTAVLLTADHGEAFGEQEQWAHEDIGEPQLRVPFLVRLPEPAPASEQRRLPVSGVDVAPTLLGLAGLAAPEGCEGLDVLRTPDDTPRSLFVEDRDHPDPADVRIALYEGGYKLVRSGLGEAAAYALFDLTADPRAEHDVSALRPGVFAAMKRRLDERRAPFDAEEGVQAAANASEMDALQGLGYGGEG